MSKSRLCLLLLLFFHLAAPLRAQVPLLHNYPADSQLDFATVYCVFQDREGFVYASGRNHLYTYDGTAWSTIASVPSSVRAMTQDPHGQIWVGTTTGFGYLTTDAYGRKHYQPFDHQLTDEQKKLPTIWYAFTTAHGIYLVGQRFVFIIEKDEKGAYRKLTSIPTTFEGTSAFQIGDKIYIIEANETETELLLTQIDGTTTSNLYRGPDKRIAEIRGLYQLDEQSLGLITRNDGLCTLYLVTKQLANYEAPANQWLRQADAYCVTELKNGNLAVGAKQTGLLIISRRGEVLHRISEADGLASNDVVQIIEDAQGTLWLGTGQGVSKVALSLPFTYFGPPHQVKGRVHALLQHQSEFYIGTDLGIYKLDNQQFVSLPGTQSQHWQLVPYGRGLLTAGGNQGVFYLENNQVKSQLKVANGVMQIAVARRDSTLLYVATYNGLRVFRFKNRQLADLGLLPQTQADCRSLCELPDGRLWVGTSNSGFYLVDFGPGNLTAAQIKQAKVKHYTKGLRELKHNRVFAIDRQPVFASQTGLYRFDEAQNGFVDHDWLPVNFKLPRYQNPVLKEDQAGNLWVLNGLAIARKQADGFVLDSLTLLPLARGATALLQANDSSFWLSRPSGLFHLAGRGAASLPPFATRLTQAKVISTDSLLPLQNPPPLPYASRSIQFQFMAANYFDEKATQFQYRLENNDAGWSGWTLQAQKEYTNLPEGSYTFRVRAKNSYGQLGDATSYSFTILPPWYRTWAAYLGYAILAGALVWLFARVRTRHLRLQNERQARLITERTQEVVKQNGLLEQQRDAILEQQAELIAQKQEIVAQADELANLNATKDKLFSIVSHDLKSPLNRLKGLLKLLDMQGLSQEEFVHFTKQLRANTDNLYDALDNLLRWAMLQMQKGLTTNLEPINLLEVVGEVTKLYQESLAEKQIELVNLVSGDARALADLNQTKLIVRNLVANAIKFTPTGGRITLSSRTEGHYQQLTVADSGVGMPPAQVSELFVFKSNVSHQGTAGEKGTGLGLLLVKEFVELNQGTITVSSEVGAGSAFTVQFMVG
jgi:signal transduction histidine kinase